MSIFGTKEESSSSFSSPPRLATRTLRNYGKMKAHRSMSSLRTALPQSSPICSHATCHHPHSYTTRSYRDHATEFSTPRNQNFGIICIDDDDDNNNKKCSTCFSDIDEWLKHANKFCKSSNYDPEHITETDHSRKHRSPEEDLRISAVCNTFLTAPEHELYNITLPSVREESPVYQGQTNLSCIKSKHGASKYGSNERRRLIRRPKPYDEFMDDVRRKEQEAERDACRKAKHLELMHRMRRKEDAINDWELQQTRKAMDDMDKIQNELERKQLMASAKAHRKICLVREKAEKQKLTLGRSTMKRFQQLQI